MPTELPPLPPISPVRSRVESLLLISDEPITPVEVASIIIADGLDVTPTEILAVIEEISHEFDARGSGFEVRDIDGAYRLFTRRENSSTVEAKVLSGAQQRLSRAALETLAVIAYRQPVTRAQVAAVRGVNCDGVIRTLTLRGIIAEVEGETVGGAHLYTTTELFLEQLGISSLDELPELAPLLPDVDSIDE